MYSYDPDNVDARASTGPMTFTFRQSLTRTTVLNARSTESEATVNLHPIAEGALGLPLRGLIGATAAERQVYVIAADEDGPAFTTALCPGSTRGWLAISRPRYGQELRVDVISKAVTGPARLCRRLVFSFHGEWRLPPVGKYDDRLSQRSRGPH